MSFKQQKASKLTNSSMISTIKLAQKNKKRLTPCLECIINLKYAELRYRCNLHRRGFLKFVGGISPDLPNIIRNPIF